MARDVLVRFRIQDDGSVALERVARAADGAEKQLEQAGRAGAQAGNQIHGGANAASTGISGLLPKLGAIAGALGGLYAVRQGFEAIISTAARFESLGKSFETAMGSVAGGEQAMRWVRQFTAETPFQLEQVASGFLRLRNAGIDPTAGAMQALGDAVSAYSGGSEEAFGRVLTAVAQIAAKGKLTGEELMQLAEANIPVYQILQDELGLTGEQVGNIGAQGIDAATGLEALFRGLNDRVGGAMAAQMTTLGGLWSNFKDQVSLALNQLSGGGAMDAVKDGLASLADVIARIATDGTLDRFAQMLGELLQSAADKLPGIIDYAIAFAGRIDELATTAGNLAKVFVTLWAVEKIQAFSVVLATLPAAFSGAAVGAGTLTAAMGPLAAAIGAAVLAGNALAAWFDKMHSLAGYTAQLQSTTREQTAFNEALKIEYGSVARAAQMTGMAADELFEYYRKVKESGTENSQWNKIIAITNGLLEDNASVTVTAGQELGKTTDKVFTATGATYTYSAAISALDGLIESANAALEWYNDLHDSAAEVLEDHSREIASWRGDLEGAIGPAEDLAAAVDDFALGLGHIPEPPPLTPWQQFCDDLRGMLSDAINLGFTGGFDDLEDALDQLTQGWAGQLASGVSEAFSQGGFSGARDWIAQNRGQAIVGGVATIYQATQQQSRGAGALQGALGGAAAGTAILPGWGTLIGAIVGGLAGYFGSGSDTPQTSAVIGAEGAAILDTAGHQGYGTERRQRWAQSMNAVYLRMWQQYRGIAEMFGSADLLEAMGDLPEWTSGGMMDISAEEMARLLSDTILPTEFGETFRAVFSEGLARLGVSDETFRALSAALAALPGQERLSYLSDYISTVIGLTNLVTDLGTTRVASRSGWTEVSNLTTAASADPWDMFWSGFDDALGQIDVLTAGWDDLNIPMRIEQGAQVLQLGQTWYQNMLEYQRSLIAMQEQMQAGIDSFRDRLVTRDMTDFEKSQWARGQFNLAIGALRGATTPGQAQTQYSRAMEMLQMLEGLGGSGYRADTGELMQLLNLLEQTMQGTMGGFTSEVESQAQALGDALRDVLGDMLMVGDGTSGRTVGDMIRDLGEAAGGTGGGAGPALELLNQKATDAGSTLETLGVVAERLTAALDAAADAAMRLSVAGGGRSSAASTQATVFA